MKSEFEMDGFFTSLAFYDETSKAVRDIPSVAVAVL